MLLVVLVGFMLGRIDRTGQVDRTEARREDTDAQHLWTEQFGTRGLDGPSGSPSRSTSESEEDEVTSRALGTRSRRRLLLLSTATLAALAVRRSLLRVRGLSMRPTLRAGDLVLTVPLPRVSEEAGPGRGLAWQVRRRMVRPGGLVVLSEPGTDEHLIIKRVTATLDHGVDVMGDDPGWSIDSRTFGTVPHRDVRRIVLGRVPDGATLRRWSGALRRALQRPMRRPLR